MAEYEPDDSRNVTNTNATAPGEPPRTGPREGEARRQAQQEVQQEAGGKSPGQPFDRATEGDSPRHPDRSGGDATSDEAHSQVEQSEDRWREKRDDEEGYAPEGK